MLSTYAETDSCLVSLCIPFLALLHPFIDTAKHVGKCLDR